MAKTILREQRRHRRRYTIRKKISGGQYKPRLAVFRSAKHIYVQAIDDLSGRTLASASTCDKELRDQIKSYTGNSEAAAVVGKAIAERLKKLGISAAVFDRGGNRYHGRVKSLADGAREGGLEF